MIRQAIENAQLYNADMTVGEYEDLLVFRERRKGPRPGPGPLNHERDRFHKSVMRRRCVTPTNGLKDMFVSMDLRPSCTLTSNMPGPTVSLYARLMWRSLAISLRVARCIVLAKADSCQTRHASELCTTPASIQMRVDPSCPPIHFHLSLPPMTLNPPRSAQPPLQPHE